MSTKTIQGKLWSIAPQNWSKHFEPYFLPMYRVVLDQLHLSEDLMLLDAGCGSGIFASMAIETGAQVIGYRPLTAENDAAPGQRPGAHDISIVARQMRIDAHGRRGTVVRREAPERHVFIILAQRDAAMRAKILRGGHRSGVSQV